jgi:L-threonylcarbamoyladenylate synthase
MNEHEFSEDVENALKVLKQGGIILYPTDTIWGIGCDATNEQAAQRIIKIKQRPSEKSFVVLVSSEKDILLYTAAPDLSVFDYLQTTKKPTTVIYEHALGLAESVCSDDGSVAIRICHEVFCNHLLNRFKKPVVSTSANISGDASPQNFSEISPIIQHSVDYIVQYKQQDIAAKTPSSIIRWKNGNPEIIRP